MESRFVWLSISGIESAERMELHESREVWSCPQGISGSRNGEFLPCHCVFITIMNQKSLVAALLPRGVERMFARSKYQ